MEGRYGYGVSPYLPDRLFSLSSGRWTLEIHDRAPV